jgi:hypothetical protein
MNLAIAIVVRREAPCQAKVAIKPSSINMARSLRVGEVVKSIVIKEAEDAMQTGEARLVKVGKSASVIKQNGIMEYKMTWLRRFCRYFH